MAWADDWEQAAGLAVEFRKRGHIPMLGLAGPAVAPACAQSGQEAAVPLVHVRAPGLDEADYAIVERTGEALQHAARMFEPDIVHAYAPELAGFLAEWPLVAQAGPGPLTSWPMLRRTESPPAHHWRRHLMYRGLGAADAVAAPTQTHADAVFSRLHGLDEPVILPDGHTPLEQVSKDEFAIVTGACWNDPGGCPALLQAASLSNWVIVASGPAPISRSASQPAVHINWLGDPTPQVRRDHVRRAGIALALDGYCPSGMAPAEAASAGAALILADIPSFQELWRGCAIFVDPNEPAEIAFAVNELAESPGLRDNLGTAARTRTALHTYAARSRPTLSLYRDIIQARRRAVG